ncbi:DUF3363 domain-containing protein [Brevundimonas sp. BR2-1]|uniref:DUF3363 domain-containing protein n=1 Tax=Brevundimonas sp. BR2-1 TaxID=3031123 RepID=UPI00309B65B3
MVSLKGARKALTNHVNYLMREGVEQDGGGARFFDGAGDDIDPRKRVAAWRDAPGHYRLMVNPEDGLEFPDLKDYARAFMGAVRRDVGATVEWFATQHHDTGRPHLHMLLRDQAFDGRNLALTSVYLNGGLRRAAESVATGLLGPRIERTESRTIKAHRFTELDQILITAERGGEVRALDITSPYRPDALRRLVYLETQGWAQSAGPNTWRIPTDLRRILREESLRDAREIAAGRVLSAGAWHGERSRLQAISLEPGERFVGAFVGVHRTGLYARGSQAVVIDGVDGRMGHLLVRDAKGVACLDEIPSGAVIEAFGTARGPRPADTTIAAIAAERGGIWSVADHAEARPDDWPRFIGFHHKRVQAMSLEGACEDLCDGRYAIPADYCKRAGEIDIAQWGPSDVAVRVLDDRLLEAQIRAPGLTWLDRLMAKAERPSLNGAFGDAVTEALVERSKRLRYSGLGAGEPLLLSETDVHKLRTMEVKSVFEPLERAGKPVFLTTDGQSAAGVYVKRVHVAGTPYAVLESKTAYQLVLWKPGMEACRGKALTAVVQRQDVQFRVARMGLDLGLG